MTDYETLKSRVDTDDGTYWWALTEIKQLREELYEIKLAVAGGEEDAPGSANMVTAKDIERWAKEQHILIRNRKAEIERLRAALRDMGRYQ
jgi:hypothetical protein